MRRALLLLCCVSSVAFADPPNCAAKLSARPTVIQRIWNLFFGRASKDLPDKLPELQIPRPETRAHNKESDKPPSDKKVEIAYTFQVPGVVYFADQEMTEINARTGLMRASSGPSQLVPLDYAAETNYIVHAEHLDANEGWLKVPFGFHVESYAGDALILHDTQGGIYYQRRGLRDVPMRLAPNGPVELSERERERLTRVTDAPATYPAKWQTLIEDLRQRRVQDSLSDVQVAVDLAHFIGDELLYEVHETADVGVLELCAHGAAQCDGASLIWATILRQEFQVVCLTVPGVMSSQDALNARVSVVLNQATPHMFGAVYDPVHKIFVAVDPTPSQLSEEKEHPEKSDPRFSDWPANENVTRTEAPLEQPEFSWSRVFSLATVSGDWTYALEELLTEVSAARAQKVLRVQDEIMFHNLKYAVKIAGALPRDPLPLMVHALSESSDERTTTKLNYLRLQLLARIAPYGIEHAPQPEMYRQLGETTAEMLARIPPAPVLDSALEFAASLPGPFSRAHFARQPNHARYLRQIVRLAQKVKLPRLHEFVPQTSVNFVEVFYPTDEAEVDFVTVDDFTHFEYFERQGLPPQYDAARVAADEMFVRVYQDAELSEDATLEPIELGLEVTFILLDLSGSMAERNKGVVRDRLVALWIEELLAQNPLGKIKIIGYHDLPKPPVDIEDRAMAQRQFAEMMVEGEYFKSKGGNNTILAFRSAIAEANKLGSKFKRVNMRLITDGEETLNVKDFRAAKEKLRAGTELNFTAVTLEKGNAQLERYLAEASNRNIIGQQFFKHLGADEIARVMWDGSKTVEDKANPFLPSNYLELEKLPAYLRQRLATLF